MSCLAPPEITRAATLGTDDPHFHECLACRRQLAAEQRLRAMLADLPVPRLPVARRRELAAELLARVEHVPRGRSPRWFGLAAAALASAAAVGLVAAWPRGTQATAARVELASTEPMASPLRRIAFELAPPRLAPPRIALGRDARLSQQLGDDRDLVVLADGQIEVDARGARAVEVRIGTTVVHVADAKVEIRARQRAIVSVHVVVGAARIVNADRRVVIERGAMWTAEAAPHEPVAFVAAHGAPSEPGSLHAFRDGWLALRDGRARDAIALFDAATDAPVAEEAAYWAAVATLRDGDVAAARARFTDFLARFPRSPYAAKARAALAAGR